jgi:uncharacterized protein (TIGR02118 family)
MVKRITIMTRKPGMSREAFADYWTRVHAPLLASHPAVKRLVINVTTEFVRFSVRNEDADDPLRSTIVTRTPDGFVELWFDSVAEMEAMYREFSKELVADAEKFVGAIATFVVDEREIKPAPR